MDGTGSGQAENRKNGAPINDGVARRVGARATKGNREAAAHTCQQRLSIYLSGLVPRGRERAARAARLSSACGVLWTDASDGRDTVGRA